MSRYLMLFAVGLFVPMTATAAVHQRSTDVQVVSVTSGRGVCYRPYDYGSGTCSGMTVVLTDQCDLVSSQVRDDYEYRQLDCREAAEIALSTRIITSLVVDAVGRVGEGTFDSQRGHLSKRIRFVIAKAAYEDSSFEGVGFYLSHVRHRYYQPPPGPGSDSGLFLGRVALESIQLAEEVDLANGARALVFEATTLVGFATGGSSVVNSQYFRPYARFRADGIEYWNWDEVAADYWIDLRTEFDRSADVLAP